MKLINRNPFPQYCTVCGSKLVIISEPDGFWEDNGEPRTLKWLKCPRWNGGRTMYIPTRPITYTALRFNRRENGFEAVSIGYTRYQTCDETVVY